MRVFGKASPFSTKTSLLSIFSTRKSEISHLKNSLFFSSIHSSHSTIGPLDSIKSINGFIKKSKEPEFKLTPEQAEYFQQIKRSIQKSNHATPEDVTKSLQSDQVLSRSQLNSSLVDILIQKFGDDWKSALGFFYWANSHLNYKHTPYACNRMIDLLGKMKRFDRMWALLYEFNTACSLSLETIAKVLRRLAGAGRWKEAISLFDKLESFGFEQNVETMNILLDTLCKEGKVHYAREAFLVLKAHIPPNEHTFNIFLHGWCKVGKIQEAVWQIEEMKQYGFKPSVITYSTLLNAYCCQGNFSGVYELLDAMVSQGCPPNVVTYTAIMNSLAKSGKIDEALNIVQRMKNAGCAPDTLFYNSLLYMLGKAGQWNEAWNIFELEMDGNGVSCDLSTYNTMVLISCRRGQIESALAVLQKMKISNCEPDLWTYRPILRLCLRKKGLNCGVSFLLDEIVNKHSMSLDRDTYILLIHGFCKCGDFRSAFHLFKEMVGHDINPGSITCEHLLNEAKIKGLVDAVQWIQDFVDHGEKFFPTD